MAESSIPDPCRRPADSLPSSLPAKRQKLSSADPQPYSGEEKEDALNSLKSRPQILAINSAQDRCPKATATSQQPVLEADTLVLNTNFEGHSAAWQHNETVLDFLRRLPVADPATARIGPWLWVGSHTVKQQWVRSEAAESIASLTENARPLFDTFMQQRSITECQNPEKAVGTITRKMGPYRDKLQVDLLNAATSARVTCGKWMIFPKPDDLPRVWRLVAEATSEGKLGPTSKVGTYEPENLTKGTLICVYTYDFSDLADVKRVLAALFDLNIIRGGSRIYYKCDAYTHLNISSNNEYKLPASLYSSEDVLHDKVKYTDGVILKLQKRKGAMDVFLSS